MTEWIQQAADLFNVQLTEEHAAAFALFEEQLTEWNTRINLTAITALDEMRVRHFLDSFAVARVITPEKLAQAPDGIAPELMDIGTGAGFPGLPLALLYPQLQVILMESTGKKVNFLDHMITQLNLQNSTAIHSRAEEAGQRGDLRERFDFVVARAVARLPALLEYMLPLTRIGGYSIAMKGETAQQEIKDSKRALQVLGGQVTEVIAYHLPGVEQVHNLIVIQKNKATPLRYPRNPGTPTRSPI